MDSIFYLYARRKRVGYAATNQEVTRVLFTLIRNTGYSKFIYTCLEGGESEMGIAGGFIFNLLILGCL